MIDGNLTDDDYELLERCREKASVVNSKSPHRRELQRWLVENDLAVADYLLFLKTMRDFGRLPLFSR